MSGARQYSLRSKSGWLRVWVVLSAVWALFIGYLVARGIIEGRSVSAADAIEIAGAITLPSLAVLVLCYLGVLLIPRLARWLLAGFRVAPVPAAPAQQLDHDDIAPSERQPSKGGWLPRITHIPVGLQWVLGLSILVTGTIASHMLSGVTKGTLENLRKSNGHASNAELARQIQAQLPKPVGNGVTVVAVDVEDGGLRWTYQLQGSDKATANGVMDHILTTACDNSAVRNIVKNGFYVTYDFVNAAGAPLDTVVIDRDSCS